MDLDDLGAEAYHQPENQGGQEWVKFLYSFYTLSTLVSHHNNFKFFPPKFVAGILTSLDSVARKHRGLLNNRIKWLLVL